MNSPFATSRSSLFVWLTLAAIALFMFFIGLRVHYVWIDEVAYAEAAINYVKDGSYTSAAYYTSRSDETHVSPSPAHSFLLIAWLKLFGVSQAAVRTLPLFFAVLATIIFWRACLRADLFHSQTAGMIVVSVALLSYGFSFSYTGGRPESVSVLALSSMFYLAALPRSRWTLGAFFILAVLVPFMQWAAVIYAFLLGAVLLIFARDRALRPVLLACGGMLLGLGLQVAIYKTSGVWEAWISLLSSERSVSFLQYLVERFSLRALLNHSNTLPKDFSAFVLLAGIMALGLAAWRLRFSVSQSIGVSVFQLPATGNPPPVTTASPPLSNSPLSLSPVTTPRHAAAAKREGGSPFHFHSHSPLATSHSLQLVWLSLTAIVLFLFVLFGMYALGKFPSYYGWMLTFPLGAILAALFDRLPPDRRGLRAGALATAILACILGFPVQLAAALPDWSYRTPARVDEWLRPQIQPDDIVYCDYPFYYLAKERARRVFVGFHSRVMTPQEVDSVSLVLLSKNFCDWTHEDALQSRTISRADWDPARTGFLGNDWRYGILSAPNYACAAFRLRPATETLTAP